MKKIKKISLVFLFVFSITAVYVSCVNSRSINMTPRQKITKAFYPSLMWFTKLVGANTKLLTNAGTEPPVSIYSLQATSIDGKPFDFSSLKNHPVLIVNTASDCGYTNQYADLEALYNQYKGELLIIAFPANDFKDQEKGTDQDIATFCKRNYGLTFPVMGKSVVIKSAEQNTVFKWLTSTEQNGWNSKAPSWNFSKYLINSKGQLTHYFDPSISPLSKEVTDAISTK